jgi:sterol desaturase/sphingolipid hydroxylase (fatty acid hydroxylase superfamily)
MRLTPLVTLASFATLAWLEKKRPLRTPVDDRRSRFIRNAATGAASAIVTTMLQHLIVDRAKRTRVGLLHRVEMPRAVKTIAGVVLLDYTLWWWHWMNHRIDFFWQFHRIHHLDRDLDVLTGIRFDTGEMAFSSFFRAAQVVILGVDDEALRIWQRVLLVSILFHHSNVRLPASVDRELANVVVTPRMHGIHHSDREELANTNYSSLLTLWDRLHGTMKLDVAQSDIVIGVPTR